MNNIYRIIMFVIVINNLQAADWMVVQQSVKNADANWIATYIGGSGLGITQWPYNPAYNLIQAAKSTATNCCPTTNSCWCASVTQCAQWTVTPTTWTANTSSSYSRGGMAGAITSDTQQQVLSHENTHIKIHSLLASSESGYVSSQTGSLAVNPRSDKSSASGAAIQLYKYFESNATVEMNNNNATYNGILDSHEAAGVANGVWVESACDRDNLLFQPISNITPAAKLPTDSAGDCN